MQHFGDDYIAHIDCTDVEALAAQISGWEMKFAQLSPGRFAATGEVVPLGCMLLGVTRVNQSLVNQLRSPSGCVSIILPGRGSSRMACRDKEVLEDQCIVLYPNTDCEWITRDSFLTITIALHEDAWRAISSANHAHSPAMHTGTQVLTFEPKRTSGVLGVIEWMLDVGRRNPACEHSLSFRATCADLLVFHLRGAIENSVMPGGDRRERLHRRIAVERARGFIHEHLASAIRLADLCVHAHAQARSLEYGFCEMLGMSPISYIKAMRLNRAHHLLSLPLAPRTITEIALDCGFGHLSQFATDYKKLFGKSPSDTLRDVRAKKSTPAVRGIHDIAHHPQPESDLQLMPSRGGSSASWAASFAP